MPDLVVAGIAVVGTVQGTVDTDSDTDLDDFVHWYRQDQASCCNPAYDQKHHPEYRSSSCL